MDTKETLRQLINNSPALQSLPEEARTIRVQGMLNADEDTMKEFTAILQTEAQEIDTINKEMENETEEIENLVAEAKELEKEAKLELRKEEEKTERAEEKQKAEAILAKLDEVDDK